MANNVVKTLNGFPYPERVEVVNADGTAIGSAATISGALPAGNNNIGDVDVATLPADPLGANADAAVVTDTTGTVSGKLRGLVKWAYERMPASLGQKTMAASLPVTLPSDQAAIAVTDNGGLLSVDDGAGSLTVDGTVAATQSGTWNVGTVTSVTNVVHVDDNSGTLSIDDGAGSLTVDGTVAVSGTVTVDTELAAAVAAGDGMANPTVPQVLGHGMVWNGTTWDRRIGGTGGAVGVTMVAIKTGATAADNDNRTVALAADSLGTSRLLGTHNAIYNGSTFDRQRNNVEGTALASAARTATTSSADIVNYNGKGILIIFNATAFAATPTLTVSVDAKDPVSANYVTITTFTALNIAGATTQAYTLYPGAAETVATANHEVQALALPRTFRITVTAGDADSCTYSVGYTILL